jgi:hypothetical protein
VLMIDYKYVIYIGVRGSCSCLKLLDPWHLLLTKKKKKKKKKEK